MKPWHAPAPAGCCEIRKKSPQPPSGYREHGAPASISLDANDRWIQKRVLQASRRCKGAGGGFNPNCLLIASNAKSSILHRRTRALSRAAAMIFKRPVWPTMLALSTLLLSGTEIAQCVIEGLRGNKVSAHAPCWPGSLGNQGSRHNSCLPWCPPACLVEPTPSGRLTALLCLLRQRVAGAT